MPSLCACNESFAATYALHCPEEGYTHIDLMNFARFLGKFVKRCLSRSDLIFSRCKGKYLLKSTTTDDARVDIKSNWLWESRLNKPYFGVKIFNPLAKSCLESSSEAQNHHESVKKEKYEQGN